MKKNSRRGTGSKQACSACVCFDIHDIRKKEWINWHNNRFNIWLWLLFFKRKHTKKNIFLLIFIFFSSLVNIEKMRKFHTHPPKRLNLIACDYLCMIFVMKTFHSAWKASNDQKIIHMYTHTLAANDVDDDDGPIPVF